MMKLAEASMLFCTRYGPSRVFTSRSESPRSRATSNIDSAFHRCIWLSPPRDFISRMLSAFWVIDRLPEHMVTMTRLPSRANTFILEKRAIWSTPALVRESEAKIIPASSDMATQ
ncbi:MAG: hypothetical protein U1F10_10605 [Burkholderiales bacterium]